MNNTIYIVIALVIIIGGGWWYYSSTQTESLDTGGAAGTVLEGSEMPDGGMIGGDAAMPVPGSDVPEKVVVREFTVSGSKFKFDPATIAVKKGETVRIVFNNVEGVHDWVVDEFTGGRTKVLQQGQSETIEFVADKAGTFEYYCSVGTHRQMGMKGSLVVSN